MIWLLISVVLLIVLIFFRIDILLVAPIVSVFLCLVSGLDVVDTLAEGFMPAFATFAKNNFLIFMTSAMFARAMQDTGMAASIARGISSKLGPRFAIPCVFFVSALLTYGGVSLFVVVFVVYPIALQLFKEANITRIIIPGAIAAGAFTWAAFCLPGSPQAGPIVATQNLGTNLMVLPWLGVVCAIFMCAMQLVFMNYLHKSAVKKGLGFEADEKTEALISRLDSMKLPNFFISLVPMLVVLITLNVIGLTVYYSMILGVVVALALAWKNVPNKLTMLNSGAQSAIFALINTCAANGFGGVAKLTPGFAQLVQVFTDPTLMSPLVGLGVATTLIAGACGSGTGGITVALSTMAPVYLDMGVNAGMMHRVASLACCGLDSLPHNGAVVTLLNNISVEKETTIVDQQALAVAAKHCGGIVIAQVERVVASGSINPRDVIVPGILVDYAVISPAECHYQNFGNQPYDAALAHEFRVPVDSLPILPMSDRKVIARRAAMELPKNAVINLGIGMPEGVSSVAVEEGFADQLTMTVEAGQIGGVPAAGAAFGGAYNPEFVNDMIRHFDFYDGGGLDVCFLGAAEVDNMGNCNVSKFTRTVGPGGFINIASNTPKCVFCGTLTAGGLKTEIKDGKLVILQEGRNKKYMKHVKQVTFSGENAVKSGQTVLFVTERAVFELDNDGIILTEIAPGIDLQTQVLDMIDFDVRVSPNLKLMDARIFAEGPMGLELK